MLAADRRGLLRVIDWLLDLPAERNREVWQQIEDEVKEKEMPFKDMMQIWEEEAEERRVRSGKIAGERAGEIKGLLRGIALGLDLKFRDEAASLLPQVEKQTDLDWLRKFHDAIRMATSADDLRQLLPRQ